MTFIAWLRRAAQTDNRADWLADFARWYIRNIGEHVSCWTALNRALRMFYSRCNDADAARATIKMAQLAMLMWHEQSARELTVAIHG